ncbi:Maf family protein [Glaciecola siphonariae]|uniref:dTTP/UTP pyrophosphatase n=1 Tax=Glaciecola siphonariae TaxID=521012 RepID=A0ABV9LXX8_9ALTE
MAKVILASASPRRAELLRIICEDFAIEPADMDESPFEGESAKDLVLRLAKQKAELVLTSHINSEQADDRVLVLGSDTLIECGGEVLGKPTDQGDFLDMMARLSGREHQVHTAVACLSKEHTSIELVSSTIEFADITPEQAHAYWLTEEPSDKAGGYAIQGLGAQFVKRINGSYSAVVGLPLYETKKMLETYK